MLHYKLISLCLALSACTTSTPETTRNVSLNTPPCEKRAIGKCTFVNGPVALQRKPVRLFMREPVFFPTKARLDFIDSSQQKWTAPRKTLTDGATIPKIFITLVGSPSSSEFVNAAAIHDAYCGVGNQKLAQYHSAPWQQVHRMFYDALRVGGTPEKKAKIMFAAVYLGGPRWSPARLSTKGPGRVTRDAQSGIIRQDSLLWPLHMSTKSAPATFLNLPDSLFNIPNRDKLSDKALLKIMREVIGFIEKKNPSLAEIEHRLKRSESAALSRNPRPGQIRGGNDSPNPNSK